MKLQFVFCRVHYLIEVRKMPRKGKEPMLPSLIAVPIESYSRRRRHSIGSEEEENYRAVLGYSDELRALTIFVEELLPKKHKATQEFSAWVAELDAALDEIELAIAMGFWKGESVTIDSDGISALDDVVSSLPDLSISLKRSESGRMALSLLNSWVDEIVRRGWEINYLCMGVISVLDAESVLKTMRSLRYPIN